MFSHVFVSVSDFGRALAFYRPLMQCLGLEERFCVPDYSAYFRDPDGNKLCVACHMPAEA